ncbi:hypothetical protein MMC12_007947 [Toensbergia leucococca]|nr:hypothetical protein [Toensbergia leucococca]
MDAAKIKMGNGLLYKWEDNNHGLEHKCGTCKTVLSSPRAKKTCFGVHEEVCIKYHKTLFYLGNSNHCDACRKSIELHDKRHRAIATVIQKILLMDEVIVDSSPLSSKKRKTRKSDRINMFKVGSEDMDANEEEGDEWADVSTVYSFDDDPGSGRLHNPDTKENRAAKKTNKAEGKMAKNKKCLQIITAEDLNNINAALHPLRTPLGEKASNRQNANSLLDNNTIDANIAFNTRTFKYSSLRPTLQEKKLAKAQGMTLGDTPSPTAQDDSAITTAILLQLGIPTSAPPYAPKQRKSLLSRLRDLIITDLSAVENEEREIMMRMAGYWRYANRRTYNAMVRNNQLWDWATGEKLEEIEEVDEDDEDVSAVGDNQNTVQPNPAIEQYDADFILDARITHVVPRDPYASENNRTVNFDGIKDTRHLRRQSEPAPTITVTDLLLTEPIPRPLRIITPLPKTPKILTPRSLSPSLQPEPISDSSTTPTPNTLHPDPIIPDSPTTPTPYTLANNRFAPLAHRRSSNGLRSPRKEKHSFFQSSSKALSSPRKEMRSLSQPLFKLPLSPTRKGRGRGSKSPVGAGGGRSGAGRVGPLSWAGVVGRGAGI